MPKIDIFYEKEKIFTLSEDNQDVLSYSIDRDSLDQAIKNRIVHSLSEMVKFSQTKLEGEWNPKIKQRYENIPTDKVKYNALILSQDDYKDKNGKNKAVNPTENGNGNGIKPIDETAKETL